MKRLLLIRPAFVVVCFVITLLLGIKQEIPLLARVGGGVGYRLVINEVMSDNRSSIRDEDGDFEDWIEIYNGGDTPVNLKGFGLSCVPKLPFLWTFPETILDPGAYIVVWASEKNKAVPDYPLHTNFKIKSKDKAVILTAPGAVWHDIFLLQPMGENISCGRLPDGGERIYGFDNGTPGKTNIGSDALADGPDTKRLEEPIFSRGGGFYKMPFYLALTARDSDIEIYYTLDGSVPTREKLLYTGPIPIPSKENGATVVRARAYRKGYPSSRIVTRSYFVGEDIYDRYNTAVISLVTDPENLFDYEKGIYVAGKIFDQWKTQNPDAEINEDTPANYNQRGKNWEREASIELYEAEGALGFTQDVGIRTFGGYSRAGKIKSLSIFADEAYDNKGFIAYDLFGNGVETYHRLLLRTSASDSKYALFRDAFIQSLVQPLPVLDTQASKPCIVYINGEYYGIHNIREAYDKSYISTHYNMDPEDVVIIKNPTGSAGVEVEEGYTGDEMHYNRMISYINKHESLNDTDFEYISTLMDVENFIEYCILQIYCDNRDWPGNNIRIWRKRTASYLPGAPLGHDGRWRWMVFDLDYGFGLHHGIETAANNSLARATEENGPDWPNPPWSTFLLRSLLKNPGFKCKFINTFADRLNSVLLPEVVIEKLKDFEEIYYPNVEEHIKRWGLHGGNIERWKAEIEVMKSFARQRPYYMRRHIAEHFELEGTCNILIDIDKGGSVRINSLKIENSDAPWEGIYFKGVPVTIEAIPEQGFVFRGWEGDSKSKDNIIIADAAECSYLKAVFTEEKAGKFRRGDGED